MLLILITDPVGRVVDNRAVGGYAFGAFSSGVSVFAAEVDEVGLVGRTAVGPVGDVVDVAALGAAGAAGEAAGFVA